MNLRVGLRAFAAAAIAVLSVGLATPALAADAPSTRLNRVRITLRGSDLPLGSVLAQIARSAQLSLVVDKDVRLDRTIGSPNLEDTPLDAALTVVLTPLGYSFEADDSRNFLRIFVYETRTFRVAMPIIVQNWSSAITNENSGSSGGGSGGTMGARIALSTQSDSHGLWEEVEKSLARLLGDSSGGGPAPEGTSTKDKERPRDFGAYSINRVAGFVTVRALPTVMPSVASYFEALNDEMGRSVVIEAKVMQVDLNDQKNASIDWNLLAARMGDVGFVGGRGPLPNAMTKVIDYTPFLRFEGRAGNAFVRALEEQGKVEVIAQPTLALGNNLPAIIELAGVQSYVAQQTTTMAQGGFMQVTVQTSSLSDGLIISMLPRVLSNGEVSLALGTVLQDVLDIRHEDFGQGFVELPRTSRRSYSGVVRAKLNETMVIGGMITTRKEEVHEGIPFLSRIPVLGWIFGGMKHLDKRSELVFTVTPREIRSVTSQSAVKVSRESNQQ